MTGVQTCALPICLLFASDGSLLVGMTSRGWSSLGTKSYGLQRVRWNGVAPFAMLAMRARPDGFELTFTEPVGSGADDTGSYSLKSYTYLYSSAYGSDEINTQPLKIRNVVTSEDRLRVRLTVDGLRELHVHELRAPGVTSASGRPLDHPDAYYTLNRIPKD